MEKAILFVDDEDMILVSMKAQVKKHFGNEFRYETANNAEEAWMVIEELALEKINLLVIISDWLMPKIKGDQFLKDVHKKYPKIKKIVISGQADEESIKSLHEEVHLFLFLKKPWKENDLIQALISVSQ